MVQKESESERDARSIVAHELGVPVVFNPRQDSRPDTHDAWIDPDGERIPLEIVGDHRSHYQAMEGALRRHGQRVPSGDRHGWLVGLLAPADIKRLHRELPALVRRHGEAIRSHDALPDEVRRLGVESVLPFVDDGRIHFTTHGESTWSRSVPTLNRWAEGVLERNPDVAAKLQLADPQRLGGHALIQATASSPVHLHSLIAGFDLLTGLPDDAPALPIGVAQLWVAGFSRNHALWTDGARWNRTPTS